MIFRAAQNEEILTIDKSGAQKRKEEAKEFEKESGESVLMLGKIFHEKVLFMKKQLMFTDHPLRKVIERFKALFVERNMILLCRQTGDDEEGEPL